MRLGKIDKYKAGSFNWADISTPKSSLLRMTGKNNGREWIYKYFFEDPPTKSFLKKCLWLINGRNIVSWKLG